jgi:hypothetical protein
MALLDFIKPPSEEEIFFPEDTRAISVSEGYDSEDSVPIQMGMAGFAGTHTNASHNGRIQFQTFNFGEDKEKNTDDIMEEITNACLNNVTSVINFSSIKEKTTVERLKYYVVATSRAVRGSFVNQDDVWILIPASGEIINN